MERAANLDLTWYRAYDPEKGRWLNRDPLQENAGLNLFAMVLNGPLNKTDPLGLNFQPNNPYWDPDPTPQTVTLSQALQDFWNGWKVLGQDVVNYYSQYPPCKKLYFCLVKFMVPVPTSLLDLSALTGEVISMAKGLENLALAFKGSGWVIKGLDLGDCYKKYGCECFGSKK